MKEIKGRLKEVIEQERRGEVDKVERKQGGNSMEAEGLKLGMYGLCMQSYGGLLELVVSDFKVTFGHLGGEAEEIKGRLKEVMERERRGTGDKVGRKRVGGGVIAWRLKN